MIRITARKPARVYIIPSVVLAYHITFGAYGFWLPNDPRGSWSTYVGSKELARFGPATKVETRRSIAHQAHDPRLRHAAKRALKHPPVLFTGRQALSVAHGIDMARREGPYCLHACSIMPDHVHLVVARTERTIGRVVGHFKARATQALKAEALWPHPARPVWEDGYWNVFLDSIEEVLTCIAYVEENPTKEGKPRQRWPFVEPLHP